MQVEKSRLGNSHSQLQVRQVPLVQKDGFVKLIFDEQYGELLGGHMIGANVTEMIAEIVAIRKLEVTGEALIKTVHPPQQCLKLLWKLQLLLTVK